MKLKFIGVLACSLFLNAGIAHAEDLQSQLAAVAAAEEEGKSRLEAEQQQREAQEQMAYQAEQELRMQEAKAVQAQARAAQANAAAKQKARMAAAAAKQKAIDEERLADKSRDQSFEDKQRALALQKMELDLEREKARVKREDDFINAELAKQKAQTDVIQSDADSSRNISTGAKDLMQSEGEARKEKAGSWFD